MDDFAVEFNELLINTFNNILKVEAQLVQRYNDVDISISELHLIDAVTKCADNTISNMASILGITTPSVTIGVNKLMQKGLLTKIKSPKDGRSVYIHLTPKGEEINRYHHAFHMKMVTDASDLLTDTERALLLKGVKKLADFFNQPIQPL